MLLLLKPAATMLCLGSGVPGGLFTPSLALGALLGAVVGHAYVFLWPDVQPALAAVVGAGAVLAATTQGPISAVVLMMELTGQDRSFIAPLLFAMVIATLSRELSNLARFMTRGLRTKKSRKDKSYVSRQNADLKYLQVQLEHEVRWVSSGNWPVHSRLPRLPLSSKRRSGLSAAHCDSKPTRSISGNHNDRDDNECRDQRKSAVTRFRSKPADRVGWRHGLPWRLQFAEEPANISGLHRI
jgi:hypothetical protein